MSEHSQSLLLSAYLDGELNSEDFHGIQAHLTSCGMCREQIESLGRVKKSLAQSPRRAMPADLIGALEQNFVRLSWFETLAAWWNLPPVRVAAEMAAAAVLVLGLWIGYKNFASEEILPLEPLLAAHSRYSAEGLIPPGDMVASNFSDHLASYHGQ